MDKADKPFYDFPVRVKDFQQRWEKIVHKLEKMGHEKHTLFLDVKMLNEIKQTVSIEISEEMIKRFQQLQRDSKMIQILKNITSVAAVKIGNSPIKIIRNKIIAKGECGLAYVSHIFPLIYCPIEERMKKKMEYREDEKRKIVLETKEKIRQHVADHISSCGLEGRIDTYVYYSKGIYTVVLRRTRGKKHIRSLKLMVSGDSFQMIEQNIESKIKEICLILDIK